MGRIFVSKLLHEIFAVPIAALDPADRPTMASKQPPDVLAFLPLIYARKVTGTQNHPKFAEFATIQVDTYGADEVIAERWASFCNDVLYDAQWKATVYPHGNVASFECSTTPFNFPDPTAPSGLSRYTAEYRLGLRPPPP